MQKMRKSGVEGPPRKGTVEYPRTKAPRVMREFTNPGGGERSHHRAPGGDNSPPKEFCWSLSGAFQPPDSSGHQQILQLSRSRGEAVTQSWAGSRRREEAPELLPLEEHPAGPAVPGTGGCSRKGWQCLRPPGTGDRASPAAP